MQLHKKPDPNFPFNKFCSYLVENHLSHMSKSPYQLCQVPLGCQIQAGFVGGRAGHIWGYVVPGHGNASTNRVHMPKNNTTPSGPALPLPIRSPSSYYAQEHNITPSLHMPFPQTLISRVYFFIFLLGGKTVSLKMNALNGGE